MGVERVRFWFWAGRLSCAASLWDELVWLVLLADDSLRRFFIPSEGSRVGMVKPTPTKPSVTHPGLDYTSFLRWYRLIGVIAGFSFFTPFLALAAFRKTSVQF